jgi:hypothetical protein
MSTNTPETSAINDQENAFICACLEHELFPNCSWPSIPNTMNWEKLLQMLQEDRLAAYFSTFALFAQPGVPTEFRVKLRENRYRLLLHGDRCVEKVREVLSAFHGQGIPVVVLKGWAFIHTIYGGDYGRRFYEDMDVLVRPMDRDRAMGILRQLGYTHLDESWPGYSLRFTGAQSYYSKDYSEFERLFTIGLHWGLLHIPYYDAGQVDINSLFSRAVPLKVAGVDVLELSLEDQIVYGCAHHGLHHKYDGALYRYYEMAALIQRKGTLLDWKAVLDRAKEWHCILPLQHILEEIDVLWSGLIPPTTLSELRLLQPDLRELFVDRWIRVTHASPTLMTLLTWLTLPGMGRRFVLAFQDTFPCRDYMLRRYGAAPLGLWPLLYLRRFSHSVRLLGKPSNGSEESETLSYAG